MMQFIFYILFGITVLVGGATYFSPNINLLDYLEKKLGFVPADNGNRSEQISMTTDHGITQIRSKMDDLALEQNKFIDSIQEQERILKDLNKEASKLKHGPLSSQMQIEQFLLRGRIQELITLNDQIKENRQGITDQIDLTKVNTEASLRTLQNNYALLKIQTDDFFNKANQLDQAMHHVMSEMQAQLQTGAKGQAQDALKQEHKEMMKLANSEQMSGNLLEDIHKNILASGDFTNGPQQNPSNMVKDLGQSLAGQMQLLQEQHLRQDQVIHDLMTKMQDQMNDLASNPTYNIADQQQMVKQKAQNMLVQEQEEMLKLAESEESSRDLLKDFHQNLLDSTRPTQHIAGQVQQLEATQDQQKTQLHELMGNMQGHVHVLANDQVNDSADQLEIIREHVQNMMDREHEEMMKLADSEERTRNILRDAQERQVEAKERMDDSLQHTKDIIEDEHQKEEDQKAMTQQRMADQMQQLKDSQEQQQMRGF